jgi:spermidine synthase
MVTQATSLRYYERAFAVIYNTVASVFPVARRYRVFVPSFFSDWGFVLGSLGRDPLEVPREEIESKLTKLQLRYLDPEQYRFLFAMPRYLTERLSKYKEVSTLSNPLEL